MPRHSSLLALLFAAAAGCALAQQTPAAPAAEDADEAAIFKSDTREVTLYVSVLDKQGRIIPDIPRANFQVTENGVVQALRVFRRDDVPVSMCIVIDSSGSMKDKYKKVMAAALALVRASNKDDEVCVVNFNDLYYKDQAFTNDIFKLEEAMSRIDTSGGTFMREAVSATIDYMRSDAKLDKKVIVMVTDGNDNSGSTKVTMEDLLRTVRDSEVLVYSIGLLSQEDGSEAKKAKRALDQLAEVSGGFAYYPDSLEEVEKITPQIAHEIRNQYILAYTPTGLMDGSYRRLKVDVKGVRGASVRHRSGYYATASEPSKAAPKKAVPNDKK